MSKVHDIVTRFNLGDLTATKAIKALPIKEGCKKTSAVVFRFTKKVDPEVKGELLDSIESLGLKPIEARDSGETYCDPSIFYTLCESRIEARDSARIIKKLAGNLDLKVDGSSVGGHFRPLIIRPQEVIGPDGISR